MFTRSPGGPGFSIRADLEKCVMPCQAGMEKSIGLPGQIDRLKEWKLQNNLALLVRDFEIAIVPASRLHDRRCHEIARGRLGSLPGCVRVGEILPFMILQGMFLQMNVEEIPRH